MSAHLRQQWRHRIAASNLEIRRREFVDPFDPADIASGLATMSDEGVVYEAYVDGDYVGKLMLRRRRADQGWQVYRVQVHEQHQRQGIATALLARARADLGRIDHAPEEDRTDAGMAWSRAVGARTALRAGIPVTDLRNNGGRMWVGRVTTAGPVLAYRGFGDWGELEAAVKNGTWRSSGRFVVRSQEGETQMALNLNDVLAGSGFHPLRGTGFLGAIEADISGLPFGTMMTPMLPGASESKPWVPMGDRHGGTGGFILDPSDPTRGVMYPDLGLGIGIMGAGIPVERIRRVYEIENRAVKRSWSLAEWEQRKPDLRNNPDWSSGKRVIVGYVKDPNLAWKHPAHIMDETQSKAACGKAMPRVAWTTALIDPEDAFTRPEVARNFWSRQGGTIVLNKLCRVCFKDLGSYIRTVSGRGAET